MLFCRLVKLPKTIIETNFDVWNSTNQQKSLCVFIIGVIQISTNEKANASSFAR